MKLPVEIRFAGIAPSAALEAAVREKIARIDAQAPDLMAWHVTIEQPHRHQQQGRDFAVRVDVTLAGQALAAHAEHEDVQVAARDAFDAIRRRIEDAVRIRRGDVKTHAGAAGATGATGAKR